jgi:NTE family protein
MGTSAKKTGGRNILVLGGGAPNFTLMTGALLALHRGGVRFDVVYMAGAGAVTGLIYLAPKGLNCEQALENTVNFGVSDAIYELLPINYKLFNKSGPSAEAFRGFWSGFPPAEWAKHQYGMSPREKLESDLMMLGGAMMCPTDLNFFSEGVCAHAPFIENVVDFDKLYELRDDPPECYLGAYCVEDEAMERFEKPEINIDHFRAALSFPFIYAPYEIDGKHYYEGAVVETLGLIEFAHQAVGVRYRQHRHDPPSADADKYVIFDVMNPEVIQRPRDLWDAFSQSIIIPLVANAEKELVIFEHWIATGHLLTTAKLERRYQPFLQQHPLLKQEMPPDAKALVVKFAVPEQHRPYMLDWTSSNLECLFNIGYESGLMFLEEHGNEF